MDVLSSRVLLRSGGSDRSRFYRPMLGPVIYREFGPPEAPRAVFFPGPGLPEASGDTAGFPGCPAMMICIQDVHAGHDRLAAAGISASGGPQRSPGG